jgi:hypothetical protein
MMFESAVYGDFEMKAVPNLYLSEKIAMRASQDKERR